MDDLDRLALVLRGLARGAVSVGREIGDRLLSEPVDDSQLVEQLLLARRDRFPRNGRIARQLDLGLRPGRHRIVGGGAGVTSRSPSVKGQNMHSTHWRQAKIWAEWRVFC